MANNDDQLTLGLNVPKSVAKINADIKKLENQLKTVKATGALDSAPTVRKINSQISALQSQLKTIKIETDLSDSIENAIGDISVFDNLKNEIKDLETNLNDLNSQIGKMQLNEVSEGVEKTENSVSSLGKVGAFFSEQMSQVTNKFSEWLSAGNAAQFLISQIQDSVKELRELDTVLTKISMADAKLSKSNLKNMSDNAFDVASKYGISAGDYLSGVLDASLAGYKDTEGIAELSAAVQCAGDMTAEMAEQMIAVTDKAYEMNGSVSELTKALDGMNNISNRNALNMADISEAMSIAGETASSLGIDISEAVSAMGTMMTSTRQGAAETADAFKSILLYIRQVADEGQGINAEGLAKYEDACNALNVKLRETRNGVLSLRDPMDVLKELANEYNKLDDTDARKSNLLDSVGGDLAASQLDALLSQWDTYETMLQQYASTGSMAADAEKLADSWEGSLNRLSNTWTDTIGNVANSDAIITIVNALNGLLSVVNNVTGALGSLGTIGLGAGLFAGINNVGGDKMYSPDCFENADNDMCSSGYRSFHVIECGIHMVNTQQRQYAGTAYNDCVMAMYHYSPVMAT